MTWNQTEVKRDADTIIGEWQAATVALAKAKELESKLRTELVSVKFPNHKASGTENAELANGWKLKAVFKQNYSLKNTDDAVDKALSKIEKASEAGAFIAGRLVKWKPELSVTEYKALEPKFKKIIDEVLSISDGTPSLELVEPKTAK
uniref:Imelysin-like domain-containing protein n=1 Tax=Pseudomonas phage Pavpe01 TaxID=3138545 RepID=A0AAU6W0V3_9VIRU